MLTDTELRSQVRAALESVSQPAPWLAAAIREEVRKERAGRLDQSRSARTRIALSSAVIVMIAAALAAAVLIHQLSVPIQVHNPPPHQGGVTGTLSEVQFITPQDGLVVDMRGLLVTHDGGEHWQLRLKGGNGDHPYARFVDPNHIVVLTGLQTAAKLLHSTADGGATWRTTPLATVPVTGQEDGLFFLNGIEGWRLVTSWPAPSPGQRLAVIYHTADSGANWRELARVDDTHPASHGLLLDAIPANPLFIDSRRGFMAAITPDNTSKVYLTEDGGYNWQLVALPAPAGVSSGATPIMFGRDGVLALHSGSDPAGIFVYVTADGGLTWTHRDVPDYGPLSFLDSRDWWQFSFADNTVRRTSDAGVTWQSSLATIPAGFSILSITAVSERVLWGLAETTSPGTPGEGCGPPSSIACLVPIRSADGGASWQIRPLPGE